ncbi:uroporphyrinogen-III C-methyltransferase [Marinobacterium sp. D7]|uniref:uroporphyrinogen-III C-methyltransferase n=1 Tax=Marinobacterium ramblicola TaxID=2849041 RepID=UPI001C2D7ACA|nr:uroporphyrinogen-III C-methyltransferase [Marinobacterium ramblicola]MBV1786693.1 uroporphyrinogen-III C-methyltransferase [Marinobacterium ramblicola]
MLWSNRFTLFDQLMSRITQLGSHSTDQSRRATCRSACRKQVGQVHLIGCGPGALDLLTVRAFRLIEQAEVVIYDRLVGEDILDLIPESAERYYVGKAAGQHSVTQARIGELMVEQALRGKTVLRLKGGDPAIFARMAEEIDTLNAAGIEWQIVPGITAASGCAAAAGIPLTDRASAHQVRFVTATHHASHLEHDWATLARPDQTLVFYMGLESLPDITASLQANGLPAEWPILLIENGTRDNQRNLLSTLDSVVEQAREAQFKTPSLIIVGEVTRTAKANVLALAQSLEAA